MGAEVTATVETMRVKGWGFFLLLSGVVFAVVNAVSYFALSDFHGVGRIYDGIKRIGWPFLMFEEGGFIWRREFYAKAAFGNFAVAACIATILSAARNFLFRIGWFAKKSEQ